MKKTNRFITMLSVLAMVCSFTILPVSATWNSTVPVDDPWVAAALAADDCEIRYTEDGTARIITATLSPEELPPTTRADDSYRNTGITYWNNYSTESFRCSNGNGENCRVSTTNTDAENALKVTYTSVINGEDVAITEVKQPGESHVIIIQSTNGSDLTCNITATLSPQRGTTGLSAEWLFEANQY